jgi:DNA-binding MltR family transcriptional regulator
MVWLVSDDDQRKALAEIEQTHSDRAAAIVGIAFLDRDLGNAIEARMRADKKIVKQIFKPTGPLGSFEVKAHIGYLLNIYDCDAHDDLVDLSWTRNQFAHARKPLQFDSRDIRLKLEGLRCPKAKTAFRVTGDGLPDELRELPALPSDAGPRAIFIHAIKLFSIMFWEASKEHVLPPNQARRWNPV